MKTLIRLSSLSRTQPLFKPTLPTLQSRTFFGLFRRKNLEDSRGVPLSVAELLEKQPALPTSTGQATKLKRGDLSSSSIFQQDDSSTSLPQHEEGEERGIPSPLLQQTGKNRIAILKQSGLYPTSPSFMAKYKIRQIKRRGRLTPTLKKMQSEKEHLCQSHNFKTSLKKLGPLARQIAGKPLEHALIQMRYSPKKAAKEVLKHLVQAKNEAIYTKNFDPEQTYISQAWVGRGTPDKEALPRARSRVNILVKPFTSISVILKENKTLERLAKEKEEKRLRQKVWVPLANRPIYGQHQYYQW
ncbi:54S ribosomal protein L22, mitochondrial [Orbilia oligospora]|uniref:54S ribosomal protein L22, mitochondrial n=1 Tax=Orbilia oligospora TaxID=2813651 RepID=A0A7C8NAE4_ORBOL|nr:54S ribosomal protein L22, mitochondrial [Orbilia oligospora]KAF3085703.1 54S ribosomal protein L22, mitochondrial [Orbilia oligospora]KAF3094468.1 54S ribosomal protein L22, mitochondrial [Orbilia oligospora]KAF3118485.1 54S ribosomal protein L22, mitochondrial [Orbilia oligospora]KAF3124215.1 54S ribosomal protein L22, mitochondrial [Orbilia oligospora]